MDGKSLIERAYELARSGAYYEIDALIAQLKRENYEGVSAHLAGWTSIRRELKAICRSHRGHAQEKPVRRSGRQPHGANKGSTS